MEKNANRLGFSGFDLFQALNPVSKRESIFGFAFNTPIRNLEKPVSPINKVIREKTGGKNNANGVYLKTLLETMTVSEAKMEFIKRYETQGEVFGLKRFNIYMGLLKKGRTR